MPSVEDDLRTALHTHPPMGTVPVHAALAAGHRARTRRRVARGGAAVLVAGGLVAALTLPGSPEDRMRLVGDGLTVSSGTGVTQIADDRVDLGDQVQAWRDGAALAIGYPDGVHAVLDTDDPTADWGDLGYDLVVLEPAETPDGQGLVMGNVRGEPESVTVTTPERTVEATVACFEQTPGWCVYKAALPTGDLDPDDIRVRVG
ncbi:hypothetical protein [Blastococcus xanthinilyticus]|uniref:Uncharacterized protein n=1 Tax=Blastococcus xanthinilyticus TaxID=1564164 RepID=A0A5S5CV10_9ACTN|nr:hypothetical protein [Blastococcus xanthinilyticus]TYP86914.1 hypothetical protein BD833_108200 [Blastococcus xanthinilyticus]